MKIIQYMAPSSHPFYTQCMDTVRAHASMYALDAEESAERNNIYSRHKRLEALISIPDGMWLDIDCVWIKEIDFTFKTDKPYVYHSGCEASLIYANNCIETIKEMLKWQQFNKRCPCGFIKKNPELFNKIPRGYINHLQIGKSLDSKFSSWSNNECTVRLVDGSYKLTINKQ